MAGEKPFPVGYMVKICGRCAIYAARPDMLFPVRRAPIAYLPIGCRIAIIRTN